MRKGNAMAVAVVMLMLASVSFGGGVFMGFRGFDRAPDHPVVHDEMVEVVSDDAEWEVEDPEWYEEARSILLESNPRLSRCMADQYIEAIDVGISIFRHIAVLDPLVVARVIVYESHARWQAQNGYSRYRVHGPMQVSDIHVENLMDAGIIEEVRDLYGPKGVVAGIYILACYRKSSGDQYLIRYSGGARYAKNWKH